MFAARAGRVRARPGLPADAAPTSTGSSPMIAVQRDLQRLQLVHPAGGAVLPADGQPDERRRHHRPAGASVARHGRALARRRWRRSTSCCRSSSPASRARRPPTPPARARSSSRRRSRKATTSLLGRHHRGLVGAGRDHSAVDPDDRLGRRALDVDRRAVPGRHRARPADRAGADGAPCTPTPSSATTRPIARSTFERVARRRCCVAMPALMTPFIIIGGKVFGWFTATESACIAVLYAGALSIFVYREMDLQGPVRRRCSRPAGCRRWRCSASARPAAFGWLLAYYQIPKALLEGVSDWGMGITGHRLLHRRRVPDRRLLPRCDPGDHHRRHDPAAAGAERSAWTRCSSR